MINYIWYPVEFLTYIAIIAYVMYTFKWFEVKRPKSDVPASFGDTLKQTRDIIGTAAGFAQQLRAVTAPITAATAQPPAAAVAQVAK